MLMTQSAAPASFSNERSNQTYNRYPTSDPYADEAPLQTASGPRDPTGFGAAKTSMTRVLAREDTRRRRKSPTLMNTFTGNAPQPVMYVRALYDYEADDRTSLSFHEGDIIQVITQLESGWWDGVINGVRGWFPSNYCQVVTGPDETMDNRGVTDFDEEDEELEGDNESEDHYDEDEDSETDEATQLPMEGTGSTERGRADFWIPQATPDGRLFYFNTVTGESSTELPLESPSSASESGPGDRMNVNLPGKTRPPPELMAQGYIDEDTEGDSASELDGESLMLASRGSLVSCYNLEDTLRWSRTNCLATKAKITSIRWNISRDFDGLYQ
jgi:son of sevenless-like protein